MLLSRETRPGGRESGCTAYFDTFLYSGTFVTKEVKSNLFKAILRWPFYEFTSRVSTQRKGFYGSKHRWCS